MDVFIGQVVLFSFPFAPKGFAQCNGQSMPLNQNQALFSLLGVVFGGDGRTNFNLPDMRGRTGMHFGPPPGGGTAVPLGQAAGVESVALTTAQIPLHGHSVIATSNQATTNVGQDAVFATTQTADAFPLYADSTSKTVTLNPATIASTGSGQAHNNMQPFAVINYCIALTGMYPPRQ